MRVGDEFLTAIPDSGTVGGKILSADHVKASNPSGSRINAGMIGLAFVFGSVAAIPAIILESVGQIGFWFIAPGSMELVTILAAVILAPIAEETMKPIGVFLIGRRGGFHLRLTDWAILGMIAGLSFAFLEDTIYAGSSLLSYGSDGALATLLLRVHSPLHMMCSALVGYGIGTWYQSRKMGQFIMALFFAMLMHGLYNLSVSV